jgi:hypothetical protein
VNQEARSSTADRATNIEEVVEQLNRLGRDDKQALNRIDAGKQRTLAARGLIEWMTRERQEEAVESEDRERPREAMETEEDAKRNKYFSHPAKAEKMRWEIWKGVEKEIHRGPEWRSVNARSIRLMEAGRMDNAGSDFMIQFLGETNRECKLCMTKKQARCSGCYMPSCGSCRKSGEKCAGCELVYIESEKKDTSKRKRGELGKLQDINMHKLGMNCIKEVTDVRWSGTDAKRTKQGDQLQFQGVVRALTSSMLKEAEAWADERLVRRMAGMAEAEHTDKLLLLSKEIFPGHDEP